MIRIACNLCDATMPSDGGVCPECGNSTSHAHESHVLPTPLSGMLTPHKWTQSAISDNPYRCVCGALLDHPSHHA